MLTEKPGVTSLGLAITAVAISVLSTFTAAAAYHSAQRANVSMAKEQLSAFADAMEVVFADTGTFPSSLYSMKQPFAPPGIPRENWHGPYSSALPLRDPWGNVYDFQIVTNGDDSAMVGYLLRSYGRDGVPGGEGYDADIIHDIVF